MAPPILNTEFPNWCTGQLVIYRINRNKYFEFNRPRKLVLDREKINTFAYIIYNKYNLIVERNP